MSQNVPDVTFKIRVRGEAVAGKNPWQWVDLTTAEVFSDKNIVLFTVPAAFASDVSTAHWRGYDAKYEELIALGIDEVYCLSIKAPYALNQLVKNFGIKHVKMLPDASTNFTRSMGMLVNNENKDMSWRYSAHIVNGEIKQLFTEDGMMDDCPNDPLECSDVDTMLAYLKK